VLSPDDVSHDWIVAVAMGIVNSIQTWMGPQFTFVPARAAT
jgi:hypothetical protein